MKSINTENVEIGLFEELKLDDKFYLLIAKNYSDESLRFQKQFGKEFLQFHFCIEESFNLLFNGGSYVLDLEKENAFILYNPQHNLPLDLVLAPKASVVSLLLPIEKLHAFFSREAHFIDFLNDDNKDKKYYKQQSISPTVITVLNQILIHNLHPMVAPLYYKAKAMELLSLFYNTPQNIDLEKCPFLIDEKNVNKIRLAKDIIVDRMASPPSLAELADEIQLPLNRLKEGFKQVYGDTVYGFLFDYRMEQARQFLASGSYNVNEVSAKIGYSAASHFIVAFRRKYGTTPKKYLDGLIRS